VELPAQGFLECLGHAMCIITISRQWFSRPALCNPDQRLRRNCLMITIANEPYNTMMVLRVR
jgi:hypothetical protein